MTALLSLRNVSKQYMNGPEPVRVLEDIDLEVNEGECLAIVGPSGSGKSTLLNLIGALDTPTGGTLQFKGQDIARVDVRALARLRNKEIGFVFQSHHLLPQCTVLENALVPTLVGGGDKDAVQRATALLERVGLGARLHHRPAQLSGGERQRVAVVRALINQPSLLLADEPTGSLNEDGADQLADLLLQINREQGMALIVVTHAMAIASKMGRVLTLHGGRLEARG